MAVATPIDAHALALLALAAGLSDERRALRFLDLTGIGTDELRLKAGDPEVLAAYLRFLEAFEPDLIAVAKAIAVKPGELVAVRLQLEECPEE